MGSNSRPKTKLSRRVGTYLVGSAQAFQRRPYKPGQHGTSRSRTKESDYSQQLKEKQKVRILYGLREAQLRRFYKAASSRGNTGETLLQLLERRADNVLYRAGLCRSRAQARQIITHGHLNINGKKMNVPSYLVVKGDALSLKKAGNPSDVTGPSWLKINSKKMEISIARFPQREEMPSEISEQLVVEFYSR